MRKPGAAGAVAVVCLVAASAGRARAAGPVDDARAALQRHDAAGATATLEAFLASAKTDPRRPEARSLLAKAAGDWSADLDAHGDDEQAVRALAAAAKAIEPDPRAVELAGRAKRVLRTAYATAVRQKGYGRALWAVTTWSADFGAEKPLATGAAVQVLRAEAAADVVRRAGPARAYGAVRGLVDARVPVDVIDRHGIDRAAVGAAYAAQLQRDGWYAQAAAVAAETLAAGGLPAAGRAAVAAARSKALAARADACLAFADRSMAAAAVADFVAAAVDPAVPSDAATADRLHAALGKLDAFDYGLKLDRCTVVGTTFPGRTSDGRPTDDAAAFYRGEWSHVLDCDFVGCGFPVSPLWMCVGCNFDGCGVTGPATFASRTPLTADLGVTDDDQPFYDAAVAQTTTTGTGRLTYVREAKPFDRPGGPTPLSHLAPAWPAAAKP